MPAAPAQVRGSWLLAPAGQHSGWSPSLLSSLTQVTSPFQVWPPLGLHDLTVLTPHSPWSSQEAPPATPAAWGPRMLQTGVEGGGQGPEMGQGLCCWPQSPPEGLFLCCTPRGHRQGGSPALASGDPRTTVWEQRPVREGSQGTLPGGGGLCVLAQWHLTGIARPPPAACIPPGCTSWTGLKLRDKPDSVVPKAGPQTLWPPTCVSRALEFPFCLPDESSAV